VSLVAVIVVNNASILAQVPRPASTSQALFDTWPPIYAAS
jgi:hypothetical protein